MTMHPYSLDRPMDGHIPTVGRVQTGLTAISPQRPVYGTTLRCSCGWTRNKRDGRRDGQPVQWPDPKVSNNAPSKGGRAEAQRAYKDHINDVLRIDSSPTTEADPELQAWVAAQGYVHARRTPVGVAAVSRMIFNARICIGTFTWIDDAYCYDDVDVAIRALDAWVDAGCEGEVQGWKRHVNSGRRRPDGDASQGYVER